MPAGGIHRGGAAGNGGGAGGGSTTVGDDEEDDDSDPHHRHHHPLQHHEKHGRHNGAPDQYRHHPPLLEIPEEVYAVRKAALQVLKPLTSSWVRPLFVVLSLHQYFSPGVLLSFVGILLTTFFHSTRILRCSLVLCFAFHVFAFCFFLCDFSFMAVWRAVPLPSFLPSFLHSSSHWEPMMVVATSIIFDTTPFCLP